MMLCLFSFFKDITLDFTLFLIIESLKGLSGEGNKAQDYLCGLSPRIRRLDERAQGRAKKGPKRLGTVPGVGMMHAPIALLPTPFPESYWNQACEVAPIFNELVDRISLDGKFIQESLSRF
ncbi:hypothetical protein YC2023_121481 [Brassica napus]